MLIRPEGVVNYVKIEKIKKKSTIALITLPFRKADADPIYCQIIKIHTQNTGTNKINTKPISPSFFKWQAGAKSCARSSSQYCSLLLGFASDMAAAV